MSELHVVTSDNRTEFLPGALIEGRVSWQLDKPAEAIEVRLFWYTRGKGTEDVNVVDMVRFDQPSQSDDRSFRFTLPEAPYSFSGKLISLIWALEVVALPSKEVARLDITLSPTGREIVLAQLAPHEMTPLESKREALRQKWDRNMPNESPR